ncbi:MAG: sigma-70 family RNA polymerase sigma factor [Chloroflexi bacterium]|nr:sigma-70 family RNA polymerase sigma factor [Chloroflexota bacterium]
MNQPSDDTLIQRAAQGDRDAFTALYDRHIDQVYRHVYYRVSNQADAEDIAQEVFIRAWRAISRYQKGESLFVSWLLVIARNLVTDFYRARKKETVLDQEDIPTDSGADPEAVVENNFTQSELREAISKLKGIRQTVITMRFIDGFSYLETSRILKKSEGAVRVIQYRALLDLKKIMGNVKPEDR